MTPLDQAHAAMEAAPEDDAARRRYYVTLAAAELFVPLDSEEPIVPVTVEADGQSFALAFDTETRLASFSGETTARAVMPGRSLVAGLAGQGTGIGVNLGVADSAMLLPPETLDWMLSANVVPTVDQAMLGALSAPDLTPETLALIDTALAGMAGAARSAYLAGSDVGPVLVISGAEPGQEDGIAARITEALALGGAETELATLFTDDPTAIKAAAAVGLRFDLPDTDNLEIKAPGMDPNAPPKLR